MKPLKEATGSDRLEHVNASNFQHLQSGNNYKVKVGSELIKCKFVNWVDKNGDVADSDIDDPELVDLRFADLDDGMEWEAYYHKGGYRAGSSASKLYVKELPTVEARRSDIKLSKSQLRKLIKEAIGGESSGTVRVNIVVEIDAEDYLDKIMNDIDTLINTAADAVARAMERKAVTRWTASNALRVVEEILGKHRAKEEWLDIERRARAKNVRKDTWDPSGFGIVASFAQAKAASANSGRLHRSDKQRVVTQVANAVSSIGLEDQLMQEITDIDGIPVAVRSVVVDGLK